MAIGIAFALGLLLGVVLGRVEVKRRLAAVLRGQ